MSLNDISLPPQLLADLYQSVLVQNTARPVPAKAPVPFLGKNEKNILIVINKKDVPFLPDKELQFLMQVLLACSLDLSHVAIVNRQTIKEQTAMPLLEQFRPKRILLLDVEPAALGLPSTTVYTVTPFQSLSFVAAPSLSRIEKSKEEKKGLWTSLKALFCI